MKPLLSLLIACLFVPQTVSAAQTSPSATADQAEVIKGNNAFAVELYGQLRKQDGNLFFSPESISTALAMTYAGARGDTASEMARTLHFTLPPERLHPAMGAILSELNAAHIGYQFSVANALWGQQGDKFLDDFLNLTKSDYGAGFNQVDFKGTTEVARLTINQWIEQKTDNKIKDLLQPGVLNSSTRLVLTDAIYFKSDWQTQFKKNDTEIEDFHLSPSRNVKVPLMNQVGGFNYYNGKTFQALEIPYKREDISLIIFLPKEINGLSGFEQSLTASNLQQWLSHLRPVSEVIVTIPKFKESQQFELQNTLGAMGMPLAFGERADFSGMNGNRDLRISAAIHKAFIDVNEEGTEAAAVTAMNMMTTAIYEPNRPQPIIFCADHPFFFLIRDNRSGGILFMGRVNDPTR
ncbi:MAG: serpin family protein [Terracidiphilus sp.]|jgi:serpin B